MQPNQQRVHVDGPLTMMSVAYMQAEKNFIGSSVFPVIPVDKSSDKYYVYPKDSWHRDEAQPRAVGAVAAESGYELSTDNYSCTEYAFRHPVYDRVSQNADNVLNLERNAVNLVTRKALLKIERTFVSEFFAASIWGTTVTGVSGSPSTGETRQWDDYTNSNPVSDVDTGHETILKNTGFEANTMVIGFQAFNKLKEHPDILDKIKYTERGVVTAELIAQVFGVQRLFVAKSIVNSAKEGATASMNFNFGKAALLMYVNPEPAKEMPSAGYTFAWNQVSEGLGETVGVRQYRNEEKRANYYEVEISYDQKVVGADLGYFWTSIIG